MAHSIPFAMETQQQTNWCWSAVSVSMDRYRGGAAWQQCSLVNVELQQNNCCIDGGSSPCNQPWYLERALSRVNAISGHPASGAPSFPTVASEIHAGRPLGVRIDWFGGGGHFVLITGYDDRDPSQILLDVHDPWFGHSAVPLSTFPTTYQGGGNWTHTYYML